MKMPVLSIALPVAAGFVLFPGASVSEAGFMGQTITAEWLYPDFGTVLESHEVVVGDGVELTPNDIIYDFKLSIDIGDDYILFSLNDWAEWTDTDFNGWRFTDTNGTVLDIAGYTIAEYSDGVTGLTQDDLSFDSEAVWADFGGVFLPNPGDYIKLQVHFVPEPATLAALSMVGLAWRRRR